MEGNEPANDANSRTFPCECCGAYLIFHIGKQALQCPYCGATKEIVLSDERPVQEHDYEAMLRRIAAWRNDKVENGERDETMRTLQCNSCGFEIAFTGALTSTVCGACGSPIQEEASVISEKRVPVDGMLPFRVERETARQALTAWVKGRWFAPGKFRKNGVQGRFTGIYLPYWTYDSMTFSHYRGLRGDHYWVTEGTGKNEKRVRKTRWSPASGSFQRFFDDVLVPATSSVPDDLLRNLAPWPLADCQSYNQKVTAGLVAKTYEIDLEAGFTRARGVIDEALLDEVKRRIGGNEQQVHQVNTRLDAVSYKHLLLPVWLMGYRYENRTFQVMVNAVTGEVQGQRPWSRVKLFLAGLAATVVVVAGFLMARYY